MRSPSAILKKLARLRKGGQPRVLDLFAGCGGLSLGFQSAGFAVRAAVEFDPEAARSHGLNFHAGDPRHSKPTDITQTSPEQLAAELDLGPVGDSIDVIVGGPPCQAFARVGRSKLREIAEHPQAFRQDPRARLYLDYLSYVEAFQPLAVLVENVPDVLNHGGQNIAQEICDVLSAKGYACAYTLLNAAYYGVPQMRERMFLVAYRREVTKHITFPQPTHWLVLPPGYEGTRAVALKSVNGELFDANNYREPPKGDRSLPPAVTAEAAIGDLPPIYARKQLEDGTLRRGARRFDQPVPYVGSRRLPPYAKLMRTWPGFEAPADLRDHVIRYLPRDYELFARLNPGDQFPQVKEHAKARFEEKLQELRAKGKEIREGTKAYRELWDSIVPPYDEGKFPNKWRKMWRDQPARTLMAHLGKDSYSHIHYDSDQARTISVREAARLQSFPDGFSFCGTMNPAFRQIGNSVPPLMAKALAQTMLRELCATATRGEDARSAAVTAG